MTGAKRAQVAKLLEDSANLALGMTVTTDRWERYYTAGVEIPAVHDEIVALLVPWHVRAWRAARRWYVGRMLESDIPF